jgi:hypothetical protein
LTAAAGAEDSSVESGAVMNSAAAVSAWAAASETIEAFVPFAAFVPVARVVFAELATVAGPIIRSPKSRPAPLPTWFEMSWCELIAGCLSMKSLDSSQPLFVLETRRANHLAI